MPLFLLLLKGLLAGLFEPPSIAIGNDAKESVRILSCEALLPTVLSTDGQKHNVSYRGNFLHIFSHIRMTYYVHTCTFTGKTPPIIERGEREKDEVVWVPKSELVNTNIGTGVKKVWDLLYSKNSWPQDPATSKNLK